MSCSMQLEDLITILTQKFYFTFSLVILAYKVFTYFLFYIPQLVKVSHNYSPQQFTLLLASQSRPIKVLSNLLILQSATIWTRRVLSHFFSHNSLQLWLLQISPVFSSLVAYHKGNEATCPLRLNMTSLTRHKNSQVPSYVFYCQLVLSTCLNNLLYCPFISTYLLITSFL